MSKTFKEKIVNENELEIIFEIKEFEKRYLNRSKCIWK